MMKVQPATSIIWVTSFLLIFILVPSDGYAQLRDNDGVLQGLKGAPRLFMPDTRTAAMGDATIADYTDITSVNINPAALSFVRNPLSVHVHTSQTWNNNVFGGQATVPLVLGRAHRAVGQFGYHHPAPDFMESISDHLGTTLHPEPQMDLFRFELAYSWSIEERVSLGIMNRVTHASDMEQSHWAYHPTLGIVYAPTQSISYGAVFRGPGRSLVYEIDDDGETNIISEYLLNSLEVGATLLYPVDTDHTYLAVSISNEKRFGEDGIHYKGGLEVYLTPIFALRMGVIFQSFQEQYTPRFGFGLGRNDFRFDYALSHKNYFNEHFHQIGMSFRF